MDNCMKEFENKSDSDKVSDPESDDEADDTHDNKSEATTQPRTWMPTHPRRRPGVRSRSTTTPGPRTSP